MNKKQNADDADKPDLPDLFYFNQANQGNQVRLFRKFNDPIHPEKASSQFQKYAPSLDHYFLELA